MPDWRSLDSTAVPEHLYQPLQSIAGWPSLIAKVQFDVRASQLLDQPADRSVIRANLAKISHDPVTAALSHRHCPQIGVDRLDYSKGLANRFTAFGRFLEARKDKSLRATLLQIAQPSREEVLAYRQTRDELEAIAGHVNGEYAELDWTPIRYIHLPLPREDLVPLYRRADIGLVTLLIDGMNLVAKEYVAAQDPADPGVLILSRSAGAAEDMTDAILVNPYDTDEMAEAILEAIMMPLEERIRRNDELLQVVQGSDISIWTDKFLNCLRRIDHTTLSSFLRRHREHDPVEVGETPL